MRFSIGSKNPSKIAALQTVLSEYPEYSESAIVSIAAHSGVADQPKSLEEILTGASNRAREAFVHGGISVGLESGLFPVPVVATGMLVTTACMLYDGKTFYPGLSSCFECPEKVIAFVREGTMDLNQAFRLAGLTENPKLGHEVGAIGVLSKGHVTRSAYMMQAIRNALIHLQNPELY